MSAYGIASRLKPGSTLLVLGMTMILSACSHRMTEQDFAASRCRGGFVSNVTVVKESKEAKTSDREVTVVVYPNTKYVVTFVDKSDDWYDAHGIRVNGTMVYP